MGASKKRTIYGLFFAGILVFTIIFCFTFGCVSGDYDDMPPLPQPNDIQVTKTGGDGAIEWATVLDTSEFEGFEDVIETSDGRFAIVCIDYGHTRIQKLVFVNGEGMVDSVTVFENDTYNSWNSEIAALSGGSVSVFDGESDFVVIDSGGMIVTETVLCDTDPPVWPYVAVSPSPGDRTLAGWGEYCALIDKTGEVVWQKAYGDPELASRHPVLGLRDGDSVVLFPENTKPEVLMKSDILHLLRLDGDGAIIWDYAFPGDDSGIWKTGVDWSLQEMDDGNLALLTTAEITEYLIFWDHTSVEYTLRMLDGETGALISEKSTGGHGRFDHVILYADGSVDTFALSDGALVLSRYNNNLQKISADIRFRGESDLQHDVIATADGGYLIVSIS